MDYNHKHYSAVIIDAIENGKDIKLCSIFIDISNEQTDERRFLFELAKKYHNEYKKIIYKYNYLKDDFDMIQKREGDIATREAIIKARELGVSAREVAVLTRETAK
jgi:hypothetical protein